MNATTTQTAGPCNGRTRVQTSSPSPWGNELGEPYGCWLLEDIEEPEAWSLASFDDLVPREVA